MIVGRKPDALTIERHPVNPVDTVKGDHIRGAVRRLRASCACPSLSTCRKGVTKLSGIRARSFSPSGGARPLPKDRTVPASSRKRRSRCTVRALVPSARARDEVDHDLPSASSASRAGCRSSVIGSRMAIADDGRGVRTKPRRVARSSAIARSSLRKRAISTRRRARCDSSATLPPNALAIRTSLGASSGQASASSRTSANSTGREARPRVFVPLVLIERRQASTMKRPDANSASTSSSRSRRRSPCS